MSLPPVASAIGQIFNIKKIDAIAKLVVIDPNAAELIEFLATRTLAAQGNSITIQCNGIAWYIV